MTSLRNCIVHIKDVIAGYHIMEPFRANQVSVSIDRDLTDIFMPSGEIRTIPGRATGKIYMELTIGVLEIDNFSHFWEQEFSRVNIQINPSDVDHNNHYESCVLSSIDWEANPNGISTIELIWSFCPQTPSFNRSPSSRPRSTRRLKEQKLDWHELGF